MEPSLQLVGIALLFESPPDVQAMEFFEALPAQRVEGHESFNALLQVANLYINGCHKLFDASVFDTCTLSKAISQSDLCFIVSIWDALSFAKTVHIDGADGAQRHH